jgi:type IV pilus assembly protein PilY1
VYDGGVSGASTTLADTAEYYYQTDLRTAALSNCTNGSFVLCTTPAPAGADILNNVPTSTADTANWQHMVTFSLGLADGLMLYQPEYATSNSGDFSSIKTAANGCPFSGTGVCNWPLPAQDTATALDDLWHAAVNGRGKFFHASDAISLSLGLSAALAGMQAETGSASSSSTSSPNISKSDRSIFNSLYRTGYWDGDLVGQLLDPVTGNVPSTSLFPLNAISSISVFGNTVTVNLNAHGLIPGDWVQVANATNGTCDPAFNTLGQSTPVTIIDANNFSYTSLNSGGAAVNTGCQIFKAGIVWSAQKQVDAAVSAALASGTDPEILARDIFTLDQSQTHPLTVTGPNGLKQFQYSTLTATEATYFDNQCSSGTTVILSQCTAGNLAAAQVSIANLGSNLVPYLRGQNALEITTPSPTYRPRQHFLGDIVNAKPAYVRDPKNNFNDSLPNDLTNSLSYATFADANQSRQAVVYAAANDGMLHAFDGGGCPTTGLCNPGTGKELWAYVPRMIMPNMHMLADLNYQVKHTYLVDGTPETSDIFVNSTTAASSGLATGWHTILVGGLNDGGRGYYALDITNPQVPIALWETCADKDAAGNVLCSNNDPDIGYSFGNPIITKRSTDGRWVVLITSGYNNIPNPGSNTQLGSGGGFLFVLDALSGAILQKIPTGSGTVTSPSELGRISGWTDDFTHDNTTRFVYGGDINGDVWRFDLGAVGSTPVAYPTLSAPAMMFAALKDGSGVAQPITTFPELGDVSPLQGSIISLIGKGKPVIYVGTGRYVFAYADASNSASQTDACNIQTQTIYALEDDLSTTTTFYNNPRTNTKVVQQIIDTTTGGLVTNNPVNWVANGGTNLGWYADFPGTGERVNIDPFLALGTLFVVTNQPLCGGVSSCTNGGYSYLYQFDYKTGNAPASAAGQIRSSIGSNLTVGFTVVHLESGQIKVLTKGAGGQSLSEQGHVNGVPTAHSVSWREMVQ